MKRREKPQPQPEPPPHIAEAQQRFEAEVPGVGVCDRCGQPAKKRHRCERRAAGRLR